MVTTIEKNQLEQLNLFTEDFTPNELFIVIPKVRNIVNPNKLQTGHQIKVTLANGYSSEGYFGFKGPRVCSNNETYFFQRTVFYNQGKRNVLSHRKFGEFNHTATIELLSEQIDPDFSLPKKENIEKLLIEEIKTVPLNKRLSVYRGFCEQYPQHSKEWSPLLQNAWDNAIVTVTSQSEFVEYIKNYSKEWGTRSYSPAVKKHLTLIFEELEPSKRIDYLSRTVWSRKKVIPGTNSFSTVKLLRPSGLYAHYLEQFQDNKTLFKILDCTGSLYSPMNNLTTDYYKVDEDQESIVWMKK